MNQLKELESQLRAIIATRRADPMVDQLTVRATSLDVQLQAATKKRAAAQQSELDAKTTVHQAIANGNTVDHSTLRRLHAVTVEAEYDATLLKDGRELLQRDITKATAGRSKGVEAELTPIFETLVALADERASALVPIMELLALAHHAATCVLPGATSVLQQGYVSLTTRAQVDHWRQRCEAAGLLKPAGTKAA